MCGVTHKEGQCLAALEQRTAVVVLQLLRQRYVVLVHWCSGGGATLGG